MLLGKYDINAMQEQLKARTAQEQETAFRRPLIVTKENARSALFSKLNRSGVSFLGRGPKRMVRRGLMVRGNSFVGSRYGQRVIVKIRYVKHKKKLALGSLSVGGAPGRAAAGRASGGAAALKSHVNYISRGEAGKEGEKAVLFNAHTPGEGVDKTEFISRWEGDRHHWRFIISPENGHQIEDFQGYVRGIMGKVEKDLGTKLEWVSAVHYDTDDIHAHVMVRGKHQSGEDLVIGPDYIKNGVRRRAQELATGIIGERSLEEIQRSQEAEVDTLRVTSLDRFILARADKDRRIDVRKKQNFDKSLHYEGLVKGRLKYLATAGLAKVEKAGMFLLKEDYKAALAQASEKNDVIKRLYKKGVDRGLDGLAVYSLKAEEGREIEGRVLDKGLHEELYEKKYIVVRDMAEKLHYVPVGEFKQFDRLEAGSLVKIGPGGRSSGKADRNIAEMAEKSGGIYDAALHWQHVEKNMKFIPEADRPKYMELHQVRLETLIKNNVVNDLGAGRYQVPDDVIERGAIITAEINAKENKRFYPKVEVLSIKPVEKLVSAEKKTWLDIELRQQTKGKSTLSDYDPAIKQALNQRKDWLVKQNLGLIQSNGEFSLKEGALQRLDVMEVRKAGKILAGNLGFEYRDSAVKPEFAMRYEGYATLETGVWAAVSKGRGLYLMPVGEMPRIERGAEVSFRSAEKAQPYEMVQAKGKDQEKSKEQERER
jgi:type IV secretory pathway VirD2 relaxase